MDRTDAYKHVFETMHAAGMRHFMYNNPGCDGAFQKRIDGTPCALNEKLHLNAFYYVFDFANGQSHSSIEFDIAGEGPGGQWFKLQAYGVSPEELTVGKINEIHRKLLAAWEAAVSTT